jgi:rsbT co-antagonist protein RsbR
MMSHEQSIDQLTSENAILEAIQLLQLPQAQQLQTSETRLRAMLDNLPVVVYATDQQGIFTYSDGKALELVGLKPGAVVGLSAFEVYKDFSDIVAHLRIALAGKTTSYSSVLGQIVFNNWVTPLLDTAGVVTGLLGVSFDITAQKQYDQDRAALQEQVIQAQQAALRELSTPLIPIADGVVVMPLIGTIDSSRAQQVVETLLVGVAEQRATTVILDITGVLVVDTQVANVLLRAAQAVKLLGARVVITGIRPDVAQTLVSLGVDLSGIVTRGTLQSSVLEALGR